MEIDEGKCRKLIRQCVYDEVMYHIFGPNDIEGGLGQIGESVYAIDNNEQIVHETTTI